MPIFAGVRIASPRVMTRLLAEYHNGSQLPLVGIIIMFCRKNANEPLALIQGMIGEPLMEILMRTEVVTPLMHKMQLLPAHGVCVTLARELYPPWVSAFNSEPFISER